MGEPTLIKDVDMSYTPIRRIGYIPYRMDTAKTYFTDICNSLHPGFENSGPFDVIAENIIRYAHGDGSGRYDILKGIGLMGPTGSRKTFMMLALLRYLSIDDVKYIRDGKMISFRFKLIPSRQIVADFANDGYDAIYKYSQLNIICIDDMGTEPPTVLHFGNKINVLEALIEERHLHKRMTHFTTNLNAEKIHEMYGDRVRSRLEQTVNFIEFIDDDFRRK